ncbi:MAG: response regulator [Elusimicrobia bacterium]|nr:response regulator [Elusimicrobiota bacterium]
MPPIDSRVLLIDDDPAILEMARLALETEGYAVDSFADSDEGLAAALAAPPDVVILDLMQGRTANDEVYKRLRDDPRTSRVPVVLCTVRRDDTIRRVLGERPPRVLFKPFRVRELVTAVQEALA